MTLYPYYLTHLPITEEKVNAVLASDCTFEDLDCLYFSLCNHPDFGMAHPLIDKVLDKQGEIVMRKVNYVCDDHGIVVMEIE